ncbi:MAG: phage holin family protein [Salinivenus sp.]
METLQDRSSGTDSNPPAQSSPEGPLGRIAGHTQGLVEDLREWIDLRVDLAVLEVEEKVDDLRNEVALGLTLAFFGLFAVLFVLTTIALGIGWLLGHPFWGFLAVSTALVLIVIALYAARPALVPPSELFERIRGDRSREDTPPIREAKPHANSEASAAE